MKRLLISVTILLSSLFSAIPAFAMPEVESCLNQLVQTKIPEMEGANAELLMSITHEGSQYHWLNLARGRGALGHAEIVIKTNEQAGCDIALYSIPGPLATKEEYDEVLGKTVNEKFIQAFKQKRQQM
ncbi:MAG: hypothetical protein HC851_13445 [Acaryochloris sp. RU_4_1]|nr:hypothetical protein [Acaryochloris sp. RU_4_1]NJR56384.1 hypothetical protein [Acaryochloris sp. CRU_2_0]